jgi:predicted MPP superfamily phosphohydrolase
MRFLVNECVFPRPGLALGGVNDLIARSYRDVVPDVGRAFAAATNGEFRVLLQHRPERAEVNLRETGVDLQLSGHTHGGVAPVIRQFVSRHNAGFSRGIYRYGNSVLYVSPGAGQWAGFPVRFCNPSEITLITLARGAPDGDGRD